MLIGCVNEAPAPVLEIVSGADETTDVSLIGKFPDTAVPFAFTLGPDGAVYVLDARRVTYSNITEAKSEETLSIHNLRVHVLSCGDTFDLKTREPKTSPFRRKS